MLMQGYFATYEIYDDPWKHLLIERIMFFTGQVIHNCTPFLFIQCYIVHLSISTYYFRGQIQISYQECNLQFRHIAMRNLPF